MPTPITLPQLAETTTEGTIGQWQKKPGDRVQRYDPLVEIMTDKVNVEMTSPVTGVLTEIVAQEGQVVPVGGLLASIQEDVSEEVVPSDVADPPAPQPERAPEAPTPRGRFDGGRAVNGRQRVTPVVARLAQQYGADLSKVRGTGIDGRVTKQDLLDFVEHPEEAATASVSPAPAEAPVSAAGADEEALPLSPVRRAIAEHMVRSKFSAPHAWSMVEVDVTSLVRWRESIKEEFRCREGVDLTYLPFAAKVVVEALKEYPLMNAAWGEDKIVLRKRINLGVAVNREEGLIVPVIKDADRLSVAGLAHAIAELAAKARASALRPGEVSGGTFTVNNTGALGVVLSYPIIYPGQAGILTTEAIVKRPVVVEDAIAIRSMMNVALSFDHRILDGGVVGGFLRSVKSRLERLGPETLLR